jgi:hypothetical protein
MSDLDQGEVTGSPSAEKVTPAPEGAYFDCDAAVARMGRMWRTLGERLAKVVENYDGNEPTEAILWATCAEACFWKATGEGESHDVKDVLK